MVAIEKTEASASEAWPELMAALGARSASKSLVNVQRVSLLLAGLRWLGGVRFVLRTLYVVLIFSFLLDNLGQFVAPVTKDPLLYTLYGGLINGIGTGLIFRAYGTSGGADIIGQLINRFRGVPVSQALVGFDLLVLSLAGLLFGPDKALYALIVSFASSRAIGSVTRTWPRSQRLTVSACTPRRAASSACVSPSFRRSR